ncbi:MAG: protein kinase, partial [Proteobacteria bacterium]|nr:protein kinase [Pseudomonadota bacterium]
MASEQPGDRLAGRYRLEARVRTGAAGECWRGTDAAGAAVFVKLATTAEARAVLAAEAELLAALRHPGIVALREAVEDAGRLALVTDYLPGGDLGALRRAVSRGEPWQRVLGALEPALGGLAAAHAAGIAHGDLKLANLVRGADGGARLVDFGVAAAARAGLLARGSPYARSDTQWAGAAPVPADDLRALGALLYELATGAPPHYPDPAAPGREAPPLPGSVPAPLAALIRRLLATDPEARGDLATARATLAALAARPQAPEPPARALPASGWRPATPLPGAASEVPARRAPSRLAGLALLVAAAVTVFVALPRWVREHPPAVQVEAVAPPPPAAAPAATARRPLPTTPEGLAELARAKSRAEEAKAAFDKARAGLEAEHPELYGGNDYARLTGSAADAEARYQARDYAAAAAAWAVAAELVPRVRAARAPALAAALAA